VLGFARLGIAVSKRNARLAVERNRLKRLLRESFRQSPIRKLPIDLVILAKAAATTATDEKLRNVLARRWPTLSVFIERNAAIPQG
jgi:ribonuclease P protein component